MNAHGKKPEASSRLGWKKKSFILFSVHWVFFPGSQHILLCPTAKTKAGRPIFAAVLLFCRKTQARAAALFEEKEKGEKKKENPLETKGYTVRKKEQK